MSDRWAEKIANKWVNSLLRWLVLYRKFEKIQVPCPTVDDCIWPYIDIFVIRHVQGPFNVFMFLLARQTRGLWPALRYFYYKLEMQQFYKKMRKKKKKKKKKKRKCCYSYDVSSFVDRNNGLGIKRDVCGGWVAQKLESGGGLGQAVNERSGLSRYPAQILALLLLPFALWCTEA